MPVDDAYDADPESTEHEDYLQRLVDLRASQFAREQPIDRHLPASGQARGANTAFPTRYVRPTK